MFDYKHSISSFHQLGRALQPSIVLLPWSLLPFLPHQQQPIMLSCRNVIWARNWTETRFQVTGGTVGVKPPTSLMGHRGHEVSSSSLWDWLEGSSIAEMVKLMMSRSDRRPEQPPKCHLHYFSSPRQAQASQSASLLLLFCLGVEGSFP